MPKIEKLSRHLRRLTVREVIKSILKTFDFKKKFHLIKLDIMSIFQEYNDEMYSTVMQLEFNAFAHGKCVCLCV